MRINNYQNHNKISMRHKGRYVLNIKQIFKKIAKRIYKTSINSIGNEFSKNLSLFYEKRKKLLIDFLNNKVK